MMSFSALKHVSEIISMKEDNSKSLTEKGSVAVTQVEESVEFIEPKALVQSYSEQTRKNIAQPTGPVWKPKSRNPFDRMKENANVLRKHTISDSVVWIEWQVDDDGPVFYALEGGDGGQWSKPIEWLDEKSSLKTASQSGTYCDYITFNFIV